MEKQTTEARQGDMLARWRAEMGMAASHLLTIAFGGHPMDELCGKILTEVRDHLSGELGKIAETKLRAVESATVQPAKKGKRK